MFFGSRNLTLVSRGSIEIWAYLFACVGVLFSPGALKKLGSHYWTIHSVNSVDELLEDVAWSVFKMHLEDGIIQWRNCFINVLNIDTVNTYGWTFEM